jgi:hypothetical protein
VGAVDADYPRGDSTHVPGGGAVLGGFAWEGGGMNEDLREPHKAVDYVIANAGKFAHAKANRVYIENFMRSKKALLMNQSDAKTVADREAYAYAHPDYIQLTEGLRAAVEVEEDLRWKLIAAQARVEIWRTASANNRAQDRATQ